MSGITPGQRAQDGPAAPRGGVSWRQDWALTPPTSDDEEGRVQGECGLEQTCRISLPGLKLPDSWCCWLENGINRRWAGWVWCPHTHTHTHTHVGSWAWVLKAKTSFSESEMDCLPCQPDLASCPPGRSFLRAGCVLGPRGVGVNRAGVARQEEWRRGAGPHSQEAGPSSLPPFVPFTARAPAA